MMDKPLLTQEVCHLFKISRPTLFRWVGMGMPKHQAIPHGKMLFYEIDIKNWLMIRGQRIQNKIEKLRRIKNHA